MPYLLTTIDLVRVIKQSSLGGDYLDGYRSGERYCLGLLGSKMAIAATFYCYFVPGIIL